MIPMTPMTPPDRPPSVILRDATSPRWLCFSSPRESVVAWRLDQVADGFRQVCEAVEQEGLTAAGFMAYEAAPAFDAALPGRADGEFPLLWFGLFRDLETRDSLPAGRAITPPVSWRPDLSPEAYHARVQAIRAYLRQGDTYQVNLSDRLRAETTLDPWDFFVWLMADAPPPCAAFLDTGRWAVCSASPELFLRQTGDLIESRPMKGTAARGLWREDDDQKAASLRASLKDRAENLMILDMMRNDLGRIAHLGSVTVPALFRIERYPTVWQMTSTVCARTLASWPDILAATFPPASCTGAPKRRAMEIIAALETSPRRLYTGCIGFIAPNQTAQFNVAIRTLLIDQENGQAEYGVGGGIVWDSTPAGELAECRTKAKLLEPRRRDFDLLETLRWSPGGGYFLLGYHLKRLAQSAGYFGFFVDLCRVETALLDLAAGLPAMPHRVRLRVTRHGACHTEAVLLSPEALRFGPIPLAKQPINRANPWLYHKTTCREPYEAALAACPGQEDVLLFNEAGEITESTRANVAVMIDGVLYTPPVVCGLLAGTCRAWLLDRGQLRECPVTLDEVRRNPQVYLMNAVRALQKVAVLAINSHF
ncbi:MAG: aminodeoxychorismate synthase component I [Pseudomonadota bacterium]